MKTLALPFALSAILLSGCAHSELRLPRRRRPRARSWCRPWRRRSRRAIRTTGTLHARETAMISAQVPGHIRQVLVQAGDRVRAGQLLVTLDDAALQSVLNQAGRGRTAAQKQQMAAQSDASLAARRWRAIRC